MQQPGHCKSSNQMSSCTFMLPTSPENIYQAGRFVLVYNHIMRICIHPRNSSPQYASNQVLCILSYGHIRRELVVQGLNLLVGHLHTSCLKRRMPHQHGVQDDTYRPAESKGILVMVELVMSWQDVRWYSFHSLKSSKCTLPPQLDIIIIQVSDGPNGSVDNGSFCICTSTSEWQAIVTVPSSCGMNALPN